MTGRQSGIFKGAQAWGNCQTLADWRTSQHHREWTEAAVSAWRATMHRFVQEMCCKCCITDVQPLLNEGRHQKRLTTHNSPCCCAKTTNNWFVDCGITVLEWPNRLPDLKIIENQWGISNGRWQTPDTTMQMSWRSAASMPGCTDALSAQRALNKWWVHYQDNFPFSFFQIFISSYFFHTYKWHTKKETQKHSLPLMKNTQDK